MGAASGRSWFLQGRACGQYGIVQPTATSAPQLARFAGGWYYLLCMSDSNDPLEIVRRLAESFRQIKFGAGVVGKTSRVMLGLVGVWVVVVWRLSNDLLLDGALILAGCLVTAICVWWTRRTHAFAERNPGLALLEGAHLLEYQRFLAQAKGEHATDPKGMVHEAATSRITSVDPDEVSEQ
jgi:hypothetical protein